MVAHSVAETLSAGDTERKAANVFVAFHRGSTRRIWRLADFPQKVVNQQEESSRVRVGDIKSSLVRSRFQGLLANEAVMAYAYALAQTGTRRGVIRRLRPWIAAVVFLGPAVGLAQNPPSAECLSQTGTLQSKLREWQ
jgi:hypothetical protein